jgi:hypothetical protein
LASHIEASHYSPERLQRCYVIQVTPLDHESRQAGPASVSRAPGLKN